MNKYLHFSDCTSSFRPMHLRRCFHHSQGDLSANARCNVFESRPRIRKHLWKSFLSMGNCARLARCWPATSDLMTAAIKRCRCTLIRGSRCIDDGRGASVEKTSGWAGELKLGETGSTMTTSLGAVGSTSTGSWLCW